MCGGGGGGWGGGGGGARITTTPYPGLHPLRNPTWSFPTRSRPLPPPAPSEPPLLHIFGCTLEGEGVGGG